MSTYCLIRTIRKFAFSLAEVLIALTVIGIIAALMVPNLISSVHKKELEVKTKQTYSTLQNAFRYLPLEGFPETNITNNSVAIKAWIDQTVGKRLNYSKICVGKPGCWHAPGASMLMNKNKPSYDNSEGFGVGVVNMILVNGTYVNFDVYSNGGEATNTFGVNVPNNSLVISFDVNGEKGPNIYGKDIYVVVWTERGLLPAGFDKTEKQIADNCLKSTGLYCLSKVISNGWTIDSDVWAK